jgi:hypothetical protein
MAKIKKLEKFTDAVKAVREFQAKHAKVFDDYSSLCLAQSDAEKELKEEVRDNIKDTIANDHIRVVFSPVFKSFYKLDVIDKMTTPKMKKALDEAEAIIRTLDKDKFEDLVEKGIIPVEVKQAAFEEIEQTPRISIKEI